LDLLLWSVNRGHELMVASIATEVLHKRKVRLIRTIVHHTRVLVLHLHRFKSCVNMLLVSLLLIFTWLLGLSVLLRLLEDAPAGLRVY
jgi:hypothetical protein